MTIWLPVNPGCTSFITRQYEHICVFMMQNFKVKSKERSSDKLQETTETLVMLYKGSDDSSHFTFTRG